MNFVFLVLIFPVRIFLVFLDFPSLFERLVASCNLHGHNGVQSGNDARLQLALFFAKPSHASVIGFYDQLLRLLFVISACDQFPRTLSAPISPVITAKIRKILLQFFCLPTFWSCDHCVDRKPFGWRRLKATPLFHYRNAVCPRNDFNRMLIFSICRTAWMLSKTFWVSTKFSSDA